MAELKPSELRQILIHLWAGSNTRFSQSEFPPAARNFRYAMVYGLAFDALMFDLDVRIQRTGDVIRGTERLTEISGGLVMMPARDLMKLDPIFAQAVDLVDQDSRIVLVPKPILPREVREQMVSMVLEGRAMAIDPNDEVAKELAVIDRLFPPESS